MATIKRKRGRPRRVELTDDFDENLIQEFQKRPDLYDRNAPNSRDKAYLDDLWEELAQCLGYDSSIVKDRMIQIRNKYHMEKKRLETLKHEDPHSSAESKWPLYNQLAFLSEHIPIRRSFRAMRCKRKYSESEYVVKSEPETDGSDPERDRDFEYRPGKKDLPAYSRTIGTHSKHNRNPSHMLTHRTAPITVLPRLARIPRKVYTSRFIPPVYERPPHLTSVRRTPPSSEKFNAFGQFLTSALIELPESEALVLVDQFTSELVNAYLSKTSQNDKSTVDAVDCVEVDLNCNGHDDKNK